MQQIIVNLVVAGAAVFLVRWLYRSFATKRRQETPSCGSCPQCASDTSHVEKAAAPSAVEFKG